MLDRNPKGYDYGGRGLLITGYENGEDWLFAPTDNSIFGGVLEGAPDRGWALAADMLRARRQRFYILDLPARRAAEIEFAGAQEPYDRLQVVRDFDGRHVVLVFKLSEGTTPREELQWPTRLVVVDAREMKTVHRFETRLIAFDPRSSHACTPDGRLKFPANNWAESKVQGFAWIRPLTGEWGFEPFPHPLSLGDRLEISPSGRHVLRTQRANLPVRELAPPPPPPPPAPSGVSFGKRIGKLLQMGSTPDEPASPPPPPDRRYGRSVQLWSGEPLRYQRDLVLDWLNAEDLPGGYQMDAQRKQEIFDEIAKLCAEPRLDPLSPPPALADRSPADPKLKTLVERQFKLAEFPWSERAHWQPDETAFWWSRAKSFRCVGLDGGLSPRIESPKHPVSFKPLDGRKAEAVFHARMWAAPPLETSLFDGSPAEEPWRNVPAPTPTEQPLDMAMERAQQRAQAALKKQIEGGRQLRVEVASANLPDSIAAIEALTRALDRGLKFYDFADQIVDPKVQAGGETYDEARFFAHVETLGPAVVPALRRLVEKVTADPHLSSVWSGELEDARQTFGTAVRTLGRLDRSSWPLLLAYGTRIDGWHDNFFWETIDGFIAAHGWGEEAESLALGFLTGGRGNHTGAFPTFWRQLTAGARLEQRYAAREFAQRMLAEARNAPGQRPATLGHENYDGMFGYFEPGAKLTPWEAELVAALKAG